MILTTALVLHSILLSVAQNLVAFEEESSTSLSGLKREQSLLVEVDREKSESRSDPKFSFKVGLPNVPEMGGETTPSPAPDTRVLGGSIGVSAGTTAALGTTAVLVKGGLLNVLTAVKATVLPSLFLGAVILFLMAGAGVFTCRIVNCNKLVGDIIGSAVVPGWKSSYNSFNRNGIDDYEQWPVYHSLDEGYNKYN